jgi:hypothetical protein
MLRLSLTLAALTLLSSSTFADEMLVSPCADALEQVMALNTWAPAYKLVGADSRRYLDDADRPAEIARLKEVIKSACSTSTKERQSDEAQAARLHSARSPECAIERDKLTFMEQPGSREAPDSVTSQRKLVAESCPMVPMANVWLLQIVWNHQ